MHALALEDWVTKVDVEGDIEAAVRRAKDALDA
jgi:hypothetical protein